MTGMSHHAEPFSAEMESGEIFARADLEPPPSQSQPLMQLEMTGTLHCAQLLAVMGSGKKFLPGLTSNWDPPDLSLLSS
jgi:hypothetical protein